ncbi:hypothetical protein COCC4DRAFT_45249 [Bipolaris maydis ATCC 48331]|uniref:Uncharacterized protein n=1 Tax=Cochliobolus heterostrophus (strain C4 / ATCC 48331 / race T) TaxID=665024 RepID=N4WYE0_COCH4|nr:uncharacterized protein COCC4DRAFT_45249 [Bipolaris maydis ATCC 48331]ENH99405.1 hypothetical protein COCC4DRAFT_45249 [Bipolaris maydis ATCC 48331]KAJ6265113.1 hypothetical protein PSV08DRAFT_357586 [Bipolaris maydis]KAJ6281398.1 hypothetical protein J3E71DRAFT_343541 [Bipolaris maydis]
MSLLNWVCATTATKAGSMLHAQAQSLCTSLAAQYSGTPVSSTFEDTFLGYLSAERSSVNWTFSGADLLRKIDKALEEYGFLFALANKRYDEASDAHSYGEAQF